MFCFVKKCFRNIFTTFVLTFVPRRPRCSSTALHVFPLKTTCTQKINSDSLLQICGNSDQIVKPVMLPVMAVVKLFQITLPNLKLSGKSCDKPRNTWKLIIDFPTALYRVLSYISLRWDRISAQNDRPKKQFNAPSQHISLQSVHVFESLAI